MTPKRKQIIVSIISLLILGLLLFLGGWLALSVWRRFVSLNPDLAVGLLTAATTVIVATATITLGRYFERKKEVEAHFREKKAAIYDAFLLEFFKLNQSDEAIDLVPFLREWQRKAILWGGPSMLNSYFKWMGHVKSTPDAQSMYLMDEFFRAMRQDIGLSNRGLERGAFIRMILRQPEVFFAMAQANPNVTLEEISQKERELDSTKLETTKQ